MHRALLVIAAATLAGCVTASGPETGEAARGEAIAEQWCGVCHSRTEPGQGPSFTSVAARPGRDGGYLRAFLDEDHFPMTTYRLFPDEKDAVVSYILSLRSQWGAR